MHTLSLGAALLPGDTVAARVQVLMIYKETFGSADPSGCSGIFKASGCETKKPNLAKYL